MDIAANQTNKKGIKIEPITAKIDRTDKKVKKVAAATIFWQLFRRLYADRMIPTKRDSLDSCTMKLGADLLQLLII